MQVTHSKRFLKQFKKSPKKIKKAFIERQELLLQEENHPVLRKHSLTGEFRGFYSINISGDWRALYTYDGETIIVFRLLGTHSQLYK